MRSVPWMRLFWIELMWSWILAGFARSSSTVCESGWMWQLHCVLYIFLFVLLNASSNDIWSYKTIEDVTKQIENFGTGYAGSLQSLPVNATVLNVLGVLAFQHNQFEEASSYFQRCCELDNFATIEYIGNWLDAQRAIDPLSVVKPIQQALLRRREEDNTMLMQQLINTFYDTKGDTIAYARLRTALREMPHIYHLWVLFADLHLARYFIQQPNKAVNDVDSGDTYSNDSDLFFYGLTLFPRCPELLLLRALHYFQDGTLRCAQYFASQATAVRHLDFGLIKARYYDAVFKQISDLNVAVNQEAVERGCSPLFIRHSVDTFQPMYAVLKDVARVEESLGNEHQAEKAITAAPLEPFVGSEFESRYHDEPNKVAYLPSLQVGCNMYTRCVKPGFFNADAMVAVSTHFVTQAYDLSMLESASFGLVYSSHTLEHLSHNNPPASCATYPKSDRGVPGCYSEVDSALAEWRRVLAPGGQLRLSVPDISLMAGYFVHPQTDSTYRSMLTKMIYGGQVDQYDFHKAGFYFESLQELLLSHNFCNVTKVKDLGMFYDASVMNILISLSVFATAC